MQNYYYYSRTGSIIFRKSLVSSSWRTTKIQQQLLPNFVSNYQTIRSKLFHDADVSTIRYLSSATGACAGTGTDNTTGSSSNSSNIGRRRISGSSYRMDKSNNGSNNNNNKNSSSNKKSNIDRTLLRPAASGKLLKKHDTGIPKLLARKHKAHLEHQRSRPPVNIIEGAAVENNNDTMDGYHSDLDIETGDVMDNHPNRNTKQQLSRLSRGNINRRIMGNKKSRHGGGSKNKDNELLYFSQDELDKMDYYAPQLIDDTKHYWREEEYDEYKMDDISDLYNENNEFEVLFNKRDFQKSSLWYDDDMIEPMNDMEEEISGQQHHKQHQRRERWETLDPEEYFFYGQNDLFELAAMDASEFDEVGAEHDSQFNTVTPLKDMGNNIDEFLQAVHEHPTKYAHIVHENPSPGMTREPIPLYPKHRMHPPIEFVEKFVRFMYVMGLPPLKIDRVNGDIHNPVHRSLVEREIARFAGVDTTAVYAANITSGFVGFHSPKSLYETLEHIRSQKRIVSSSNPYFTKIDDNETSLLLNDIPIGHTSMSLSHNLFPEGTKVGDIYGNDLSSPDCFTFLSNSSVMVQFKSKEQAHSAFESSIVREHLRHIFGQHYIQFFRARRELIHNGFGGPHKTYELRKMGPRLIVDGYDMPSKQFFISHAGVLKLTHLDPTLSKYDISQIFQAYSTIPRDINGSIEYVTDETGLRTDQAYIGFDIPGDCEHAIEALKGRIKLGDRVAQLKLVKERDVPNRPTAKPQRRPDRSVDDLIADLTGWEQYIAPNDLAELEKAGISKIVLDEAFRSIRYGNATFGPFDHSLRNEALRPEKEIGASYKEIVQLYITTLKECIATPDNVGITYEALHFPGEPIDMSIFDEETKRQQNIIKSKVKS